MPNGNAIRDDEADDGLEFQRLFARRRVVEDPELDITSMIDMTFLLLIFFLVTSVPDVQRALDLPAARHGTAADPRSSLVITIAEPAAGREPTIYLADGRIGPPLPTDRAAQEAALREAIVQAFGQGRPNLLIKAERGIKSRYVARVGTVAASVPGVKLHLAVKETE